MKLILFLLAFALVPTLAPAKTTTSMTSERGFFSLAIHGGADERRALTSTGEYSAFRGAAVGGGADFRLIGEGRGELRLFALANLNDLGSKSAGGESLKESTAMWGLKAFFTDALYLGAAYGTTVQKFRVGSVETSTTNPVMGLGLGFEQPIGGNFFVGLNAWYQNNPIRAEGSVSNSFAEGASASLNLIWSPPLTIITTTVTGR